MPLESHHKLSVRKKQQKSSTEKPNTETIRERVRAILNREKNEGRTKIVQETRGKLKELSWQIKVKNAPNKWTPKEKKWDGGSDWTYQGLGGKSVKNHDGTTNMKVLGLKFGNESGEIALGAMHRSERDVPGGKAQEDTGFGIVGTIKF